MFRLNGIQEARGSNPLGSTIRPEITPRTASHMLALLKFQAVLAALIILNLIGLTIAAYRILKKK